MRHLLIIVILFLTACGSFTNPGRVMKKEMPKDAPPDYKKGWEDGCESGLGSAYTNTWYKTFHSYRKDNRLLNNQLYIVGWDDGNRYCRHYAGQWVRWGYFDDLDSQRDKNVPEQYSFAIPGWNGVSYESGIPEGVLGAENKDLYGNAGAADTLFGWKANAGDFFVPGKSPF